MNSGVANSTTSDSETKSKESSRQQLSAFAKDLCGEEREDFQHLMDEVGTALNRYCRRRPGVAAGAIFAVGFFLGWKIKPW